jgi:hypothetical protein
VLLAPESGFPLVTCDPRPNGFELVLFDWPSGLTFEQCSLLMEALARQQRWCDVDPGPDVIAVSVVGERVVSFRRVRERVVRRWRNRGGFDLLVEHYEAEHPFGLGGLRLFEVVVK